MWSQAKGLKYFSISELIWDQISPSHAPLCPEACHFQGHKLSQSLWRRRFWKWGTLLVPHLGGWSSSLGSQSLEEEKTKGGYKEIWEHIKAVWLKLITWVGVCVSLSPTACGAKICVKPAEKVMRTTGYVTQARYCSNMLLCRPPYIHFCAADTDTHTT